MRTSTHWDSQFITPAKTALRKFWCRLPTRGCLSRLAQTWTVSPKQPQNYRDQCFNCQFPLKGKIYCFISPFLPGFDRQIIDILLYRLTRAWVEMPACTPATQNKSVKHKVLSGRLNTCLKASNNIHKIIAAKYLTSINYCGILFPSANPLFN